MIRFAIMLRFIKNFNMFINNEQPYKTLILELATERISTKALVVFVDALDEGFYLLVNCSLPVFLVELNKQLVVHFGVEVCLILCVD